MIWIVWLVMCMNKACSQPSCIFEIQVVFFLEKKWVHSHTFPPETTSKKTYFLLFSPRIFFETTSKWIALCILTSEWLLRISSLIEKFFFSISTSKYCQIWLFVTIWTTFWAVGHWVTKFSDSVTWQFGYFLFLGYFSKWAKNWFKKYNVVSYQS